MAGNFLSPAMSRLTMNTSPVGRSSSALETPASSYLQGLNFAGSPSTAQVQIRWKAILDMVESLRGNEPMYVREETMDALFQGILPESEGIVCQDRGSEGLYHVRDRVEYFFVEPPLHQANENRGSLSPEIKLRMKLLLWELMVAIGWKWPDLKITSSGMGLYACELSLFPNHVHIGLAPKTLIIIGSEEESEEEAIESSCRAAIALLEREKSICLVDLNFNYRSHGELYIVEAREAFHAASFMARQVLGEWEAMVSEIHMCKEYCRNLDVDPSSEGANLMYTMKYNNIAAVADLHEACLADLQLAKNRVSINDE